LRNDESLGKREKTDTHERRGGLDTHGRGDTLERRRGGLVASPDRIRIAITLTHA
jgi:hypothetical protein